MVVPYGIKMTIGNFFQEKTLPLLQETECSISNQLCDWGYLEPLVSLFKIFLSMTFSTQLNSTSYLFLCSTLFCSSFFLFFFSYQFFCIFIYLLKKCETHLEFEVVLYKLVIKTIWIFRPLHYTAFMILKI